MRVSLNSVMLLLILLVSSPALSHHTQGAQYRPWIESSSNFNGIVWVGHVRGNGVPDRHHSLGNRSTAILVPQDIIDFPNEPYDIVYWYHGLGGWSDRAANIRISKRINDITGSCPGYSRFVVIVPEMPWSKNTDTPRSRQGYAWNGKSKVENLVIFHNNIIKVLSENYKLKKENLDSVRIAGHSAGGSAIMSAARSGALDIIKPTVIVSSDAGYGSWTSLTYKHYVKANPNTTFYMLVRKWDTPYNNTVKFVKRQFKSSKHMPENMVLYTFDRRYYSHGDIGDEAMLWIFEDPQCEGREGC
jgi:hypothetical protein